MALPGPLAHTLCRLIADRARLAPESTAFWTDGATWSYRDLDRYGRGLARGLAGLGIGPRDRVAFWLPNGATYLGLFFACARLGAIAVAVNTRFRAAEIGDIVGRCGARALALAPGFQGIDFPGILAAVEPGRLARLEFVIACGSGALPAIAALPPTARIVSADELAAGPPLDTEQGGPDSGVAIFTTSGTTRAPKFVLHGQAGIVRHAHDVATRFGLDAPDAASLQALPLCGVFGFTQAMATLAAGRPMALMPAFDAAEAARLVARHRLTHGIGTDEMLERMLDAAGAGGALASLRFAGYASFAAGTREDLAARLDAGGTKLVGLFGMSELLALFAAQRPDDPVPVRARPGGFPVSTDGAIRVRDPETGRLQPAGEPGMIELKGPSAMLGYFGDAAATAATLTADGYVRTGDLGYAVGDGSFVFLARMGDALRLGGFLVSPREIEAFLESDAAVAQAQVVGVPAAGGAKPVGFVVLTPGTAWDEAALIARCQTRLARHKVPARIFALDAFPVTSGPNGTKIQRGRLRELAIERLGERLG
jgi:fatty-acyl-CoA synthase